MAHSGPAILAVCPCEAGVVADLLHGKAFCLSQGVRVTANHDRARGAVDEQVAHLAGPRIASSRFHTPRVFGVTPRLSLTSRATWEARGTLYPRPDATHSQSSYIHQPILAVNS